MREWGNHKTKKKERGKGGERERCYVAREKVLVSAWTGKHHAESEQVRYCGRKTAREMEEGGEEEEGRRRGEEERGGREKRKAYRGCRKS